MTNTVNIPTNMLPEDGRFGSGPSKIRPEQVQRSTRARAIFWAPRTARPRSSRWSAPSAKACRISSRFPTAMRSCWATAAPARSGTSPARRLSPARRRSARTAPSARNSPSPRNPRRSLRIGDLRGQTGHVSPAGAHRICGRLLLGAQRNVHWRGGPGQACRRFQGAGALTLIDATSGAGALNVDISQTDAYYFSPQKAFGSDGGLWIAVLSPAAIDRAYGIAKSVSLPGARRWIPPFLSLTSAIENSRKDQTLNTPAVATLVMLENQVRWLNDNGGLAWATARCARSASLLYQWAERSDYAQPFVSDENARSNAVVTIDLDEHQRFPKWSPRCARTALWTPTATASSAATSCASACFRPWSRATSRRLRSASITWSSTCDARTEVR